MGFLTLLAIQVLVVSTVLALTLYILARSGVLRTT